MMLKPKVTFNLISREDHEKRSEKVRSVQIKRGGLNKEEEWFGRLGCERKLFYKN